MTRRVTVSLPDDIAAYLDTAENASARVAEALRAHMNRSATTEAMLKAIGFNITEKGKARWREKIKPFTPAQRAEFARRRELWKAGKWPTDSAHE